ncbi:MAG: acyl-CoA dehydrogenase family protein [Deltaproteobacteria bacterium]|nr:acyl-CoA dehydrogenase family protein [Deltaproteobacteria bacterium]
MDYRLSEEMKLLQNMAAKFARNEVAPCSAISDEEERYRPDINRKAAALGLIGAWVPEAYGGAGFGVLGHALITEELSRVDTGICLSIVAAPFGCEAIYQFGSEEQKQAYLPPVCRGEMVSAGAFTEPNAGTDVSGVATRAVRDGDDYLVNGNKMFITNGTVCDFMVALVVTEPEARRRHDRFSLLIIPAHLPGITRNKIKGKMGIRSTDTAEIAFVDVRVPRKNLVGVEGRGFHQVMHFFDKTRIMVAAQGVGLGQGCLDEAVRYAKERSAFGSPIGNFQLTQAKLTEMAIRVEASRNLVYKAAWLYDQGTPDFTLAAMAKYYCGQTAVFCANAALEIHGGYGYINEYKVQKFYRDAKILELYEGTKEAEIMTIGKVLLS